jgi:hypothetical protein
MADSLDQDSPLDTLVQNYSLPTIRAAMKLNANDPAAAIAALQPSLKYELSINFSFNGGGLNGSTQHSARTQLALKTKAKNAG